MKQKTQALGLLIILSAFFMPLKSMAQDEVEDLFKGGRDDASKLVGAYLNPLFKGLGLGLNSGWYTSAKTKGLLRFDVRITVTAAFVPTKDQSYNTNNLGLQGIRPATGQNGIGPTAFGKDAEGSTMEFYNGNTPTGQTFKLPEGTGRHYVPSPQVQLTVGLPKNIDVSLRMVPSIKLGDAGKLNLFGVGTKVELLPLIMGKKEKLLPFDLALGLGYTRLNYNLPIDADDKNNNQELDLKINGFSAEAIISKQLLFFTPFASVGYNTASSTLKALGTYEFETPTGTQTYTDPFNIKNDVNGLRASLGFQLKLAFFKIYAAYTQAEYGYVNGGIGLGIGK